MKKITYYDSDSNRIKRSKRWLGMLLICIMFCMGQVMFAQSVSTQTFSTNGFDRLNTQLVITPANITVNQGQPILGITIVGFENHYDSSTGADACITTSPDEYDWYDFNMSVTGGTSDGMLLSGVCGDQIIGIDATGFTNITIGTNDTDNWLDMVYFNIVLQVTYETPTCLLPVGLVSGNITALTADVSWDESLSESATGYEYVYSTSNTAPTGSGEFTDLTYAGLEGLLPQTTYYVFVRTACEDDDFSAWSAPISFTTACVAVSTFPFVETFNTDSASRQCWTAINGNSDTYTWAYGTAIPRSGDSAQLYTDFTGSNNDYLVTPQLILGAEPKRLKFWVRHRSNGEPENLNVRVSTTGRAIADFTTTLLTLAVGQITVDYTEHIVDLSDYADSTIYIAFAREDEPHNGWYLAIDDVTIEDIPNCSDQTGLVVGGITFDSASTSWDDMSENGVTEYEYAVTTSATPPTADTITSTDIFYEASGLASNTIHYLHVRTVCDGGDFGIWVTKTFTTQVAPSAIPWNESFSTTTALGWNMNGYVLAAANESIGSPASVKFGDGTTNILRRNSYSSSTTGSFSTVSVGLVEVGYVLSFDYKLVNYYTNNNHPGADSGNYTVEVSTDFGATYGLLDTVVYDGVAGWQTKTYPLDDYEGEYVKVRITDTWTGASTSVDYYIGFDNFYIGIPPTCPTVTGLVVGDITHESVATSWNDMSEDGVTEYEYAITTSATPPTADTITSTDIFYEASGLASSTIYYLHVRAICDDEDFGNWSTTSFTTLVAPSTIPWTEGFDATTVPGWSSNGYELAAANASIGSPTSAKFGDGTTNIVRRNPYSSSTTGSFTTVSVGLVESGHILSFDYKLVNYYVNNDHPGAGSGNYTVEISTDFGATYDLLDTVVYDGVAGWHTQTYSLDDYEGEYVKIKITDTWTGTGLGHDPEDYPDADYYIGFDNFYIGAELSAPVFDKSALKVYPNPTKNILNILFNQEISNVEVYNLVGQRVVTKTLNANEGQVDMSNLSSGAYFVKITSNNVTKTVKIIKE